MRFPLLLSLFALLLLPACAETELLSHVVKSWPSEDQSSVGTFKVGNPYKVEGQWYKPEETYSYSESGIASWYGPGFQGGRTANGERFDQNELTAAHRTLQMPSFVRVTNLENGRSLVVRVNDRGPFKRGRVIDVTRRAAELLGFIGRGTAKVRLDLMVDESKALAMAAKRGENTQGMEVALNQAQPAVAPVQQPQTEDGFQQVALESPSTHPDIQGHMHGGQFLPDPVVTQEAVHPTGIYVQAGSFAQSANAERLVESLKKFGNTQIYPTVVHGAQFFRVRVGPVQKVPDADALLSRVIKGGYKQAIIVVD